MTQKMRMKATNHNCPYCNPDIRKPLNDEGMLYSGLEIHVLGYVGILRCRSFPLNNIDTYTSQDAVNINYCPMCGRRFHDD